MRVLLDPGIEFSGCNSLRRPSAATRLLNLSNLRQAGDVNAVASCETRTLLHRLVAEVDRIRVIASEIMSDSESPYRQKCSADREGSYGAPVPIDEWLCPTARRSASAMPR